jgi:hypothetical protein
MAYTEQIEITVDNFTAACKETGPAVFICFVIFYWSEVSQNNHIEDILRVKT